MPDDIFAEGLSTDPYWWDAAPRPQVEPRSLPPHCDLVVVGSGFTGLSAALTASRGGRETIVLTAAPRSTIAPSPPARSIPVIRGSCPR